MKARNPIPADGAVDVDTGTLEWTAGATAVSHIVYFSEDDVIDDADLLAESPLNIAAIETAPGTTYYWRVDEVDADGVIYEGAVWSFTTIPLEAHFPAPANGATDVEPPVTLSWTPGKVVVMHDLYFGTDEAAVAARDMSTFKGKLMQTTYDPGLLELFATYYWAVDEFTPTGTVAGPVWSFSMAQYIVIEGEETTLDYDNTADPLVSELVWDVPADLTRGGVMDLTLRFHGGPGPEGGYTFDEAAGTYEITGSGADVWGTSDQFHYVYQELTGDATITAHVVDSGAGSNTWAKGGVMIRESLDASSKHMIMALTGGDGGGIAFQGRFDQTGANSSSLHGDITASPPYWVRLTRTGNTITGYTSADGVTWTQFTDTSPDNAGGAISNPMNVEMADPVLIGLFVTSHAAGEKRTFTFDNVTIEGNVSTDLVSADIGIPANSAESVYVVLEDAAGNIGKVTHSDLAATRIDQWWKWRFPICWFTSQGVNPKEAVKFTFGVGNGELGGIGTIRVDDIRVVKPEATAGHIVFVSGDHDYDLDGLVDDYFWVDMLRAEDYAVDYRPGHWTTLDEEKIAALNAADLVIISRCTSSGDYADGDEPAQWNAITTPIILSSTHLLRSSRWKWVDSTEIVTFAPATMEVWTERICPWPGPWPWPYPWPWPWPYPWPPPPPPPYELEAIDEVIGPISFIDGDPGNGVIHAIGDGLPWIITWDAGVEFYDGSGQIAGGPRMFFAAGTQEAEGGPNWGEWNLSPAGTAMFLNAIKGMMTPSLLDNWAAVVQAEPHGFFATNVADGLYDIGTYGGEQTYEFIVRSNPDETEASMCLIGRRDFGDTQVGLKFDQWNDTGQYGATVFGVADFNFGVANHPGEDVHLVFVSSEAEGTCSLYVNGVYQATVDAAIPLSGLVGIGYGAQGAEGNESFDNFDGTIAGMIITEGRLSDEQIAAHAAAYFRLSLM
jgi:hypothetical protein